MQHRTSHLNKSIAESRDPGSDAGPLTRSWACDSKWRPDVVVNMCIASSWFGIIRQEHWGNRRRERQVWMWSFISTTFSFAVCICWRCNCTSSFQWIYSVRSLRGIPLRFSVISATNGNRDHTRTLENVSGRLMDVYEFIFFKIKLAGVSEKIIRRRRSVTSQVIQCFLFHSVWNIMHS